MAARTHLWTREELTKLIALTEETYSKANSLAEAVGKKIYEGLMSAMNFRGSIESAIKYLAIQWKSGMPLAVLTEKNLWEINSDFLASIIGMIDPKADVEKIVKRMNPDPRRFVGSIRLNIASGWGEIASFYILNSPHPRMTIIIYLLHMAIYVNTFLTATISEVYTASEDFLNLIDGIDTKRGAVEFLTRLLRRRYIAEDQYSQALEAVENRRELHFASVRELLREEEARLYLAETLLAGKYGLLDRLHSIIEKYNNKPIPREEVAVVVGEIYSIINGLKNMLKDYEFFLSVLNNLLIKSGKDIDTDMLRKAIEDITAGRE